MIINVNTIIHLVSEQMWLVVILSLPVIGATAAAGVLISLIQAVTQVQEQTIQFLIKLVVFGLVTAATGHWMLQSLINYSQQIFLQI